MDIFSQEELVRVQHLLECAIDHKKANMKYSAEIQVKIGLVKVYHMGSNNAVIRMDLKLNN